MIFIPNKSEMQKWPKPNIELIPDIMYFGASEKHNILKDRVFLSPYIGIASIFMLNTGEIVKHAAEANGIYDGINSHNTNIGFVEWGLDDHELKMPLDTVRILHNIPELRIKDKGYYEGYIHIVDVSKVKDQLILDKSMDQNREVVYIGSKPLPIIDIKKHKVIYTFELDKSRILKYGVSSIIRKNIKESKYNEICSYFLEKNTPSDFSIDYLETPGDLLRWVEKNIKYGYYGSDGKYHGDMSSFKDTYRLSSAQEVIKNKCGICYDHAELHKYFLNKKGIRNETYYMDFIGERHFTHVFTIYYLDNKVCVLETSMHSGIYKCKDLNEAFKLELSITRLEHRDKTEGMDAEIHKMNGMPKHGCTRNEYMEFGSKQPLVLRVRPGFTEFTRKDMDNLYDEY